jgi:hypothetical protein
MPVGACEAQEKGRGKHRGLFSIRAAGATLVANISAAAETWLGRVHFRRDSLN